MSPKTEPAPSAVGKKPRLALFLATGFGLGYLPKAPGTFGSLLGLGLALCPWFAFNLASLVTGGLAVFTYPVGGKSTDPFVLIDFFLAAGAAVVGVWVAGRAEAYCGQKDPQIVVIDEISGQQLTLLLGGFWVRKPWDPAVIWSGHPLGISGMVGVNWKYFVLGFILFRVFDIWKPFPVRQAERFPGGWGIMADDWVAALYAALGLWLARAAGL